MVESVYESTPVSGENREEERTEKEAPSLRIWLLRYRERLLFPLVVAAGVLLWDLLVRWQQYPTFVLPSPAIVAAPLGDRNGFRPTQSRNGRRHAVRLV